MEYMELIHHYSRSAAGWSACLFHSKKCNSW